jgi:hypothetical protein
MFNAFLEPCCPCGIGTNGNRVIAAVALPGTIPLASPKVTDYSIRRQPVARLSSDKVAHISFILTPAASAEQRARAYAFNVRYLGRFSACNDATDMP